MNNLENQFIENLSNDLKPGQNFRPSTRALVLGLVFTGINILGMLAYQPFRSNVFAQMMEYGRFTTEIFTAFILTGILIYVAFNAMVPGKTLKNIVLAVGSLGVIVFVYTIMQSFSEASPPSSFVGARAFCVEEVALYGFLGLGIFGYFVRQSYVGFSILQFFLMGVASGLVPGILMQLACMYSPKHALILHYGPSLILGALACLIFPFIKKRD